MIRALLVGAFLAPGCAGQGQYRADAGEEAVPGNALVLERADLGDPALSVVDAMARRYPWMVVKGDSGCPSFEFRNVNTAPGITEPLVYVNGARVGDTCVLSGLSATDVERVEIYPMGFTSRPGYATSSHGLILVFMRDGR